MNLSQLIPAEQPGPERPNLPRLISALIAVLALAAATAMMASNRTFGFSVPVGFVCFVAAGLGLLDLFQCFDEHPELPSTRLSGNDLLRRLAEVSAAGLVFIVALRLAVSGVLPMPRLSAALIVPITFLAVTLSVFRLAKALAFAKGAQPLHRRYGFWLMMFHALVYLPLLGSFSLIDPWETHYGEVAREMLVRDDWISLWWAQDGWFWSKPILDFWLQGLSFSLLGVQVLPDQMLAGLAQGLTPYPEWAARLPIFLMTVVASYVFYKAIGRVVHPRAGFLSSLVLSTTPYWFLLGHQSMTDMPYVAPMVACLSFALLAVATDIDTKLEVKRVRLGRREFSLHASHALLMLVLLVALPQICYLASRNLSLNLDSGVLRVHADTFLAGSGGGNCGLPGNAACSRVGPRSPLAQPGLMACLWLFLLLLFVKSVRGETRARNLYYLAAWCSLAFAVMAKGAPGLVLPLFVIGAFLAATGRWRQLLDMRPFGLCMLFVVLVLPWYVQMVARHGPAFLERLLLHDMYKRAFEHVHDTNDGVDVSFRYYLWQLGYGLFPWSGLAAGGLVRWVAREAESAPEGDRLTPAQASAFFALWFIAAFAMFTLSGTKFHHYILPAVPPLAALSGLLLHELLGNAPEQRAGRSLIGLGIAIACSLCGIVWLAGGSLRGVSAVQGPSTTAPVLGWLSLGAGIAAACVTLWLARRPHAAPFAIGSGIPFAGFYGVMAAMGAWLVGRDLLSAFGENLPGQVRLMQLFTYQYKRPWPDSLQFEPVLLAFVLLAATLFAGIIHPKLRPAATLSTCLLSIAWCAWGLDVYLVRAAPHWGQRESIAVYYRERVAPEPPLVAFQMNWKGENFYTGNRLVAFVKSGEPFKRWLEQQRSRGVRTLYVTTEPSRIAALKRELGDYHRFERLTDDRVNNKFMIARVDL